MMTPPEAIEIEVLGHLALLIPYSLAVGFAAIHLWLVDLRVGKERGYLFDRLGRASLLLGAALHSLVLLGPWILAQMRLGWSGIGQDCVYWSDFHRLSLWSCAMAWVAFLTQNRHRPLPAVYFLGAAMALAGQALAFGSPSLTPYEGAGSGPILVLLTQVTIAVADAVAAGVASVCLYRWLTQISAALGSRPTLNRPIADDPALRDEINRGLQIALACMIQGCFMQSILDFASGGLMLSPRWAVAALLGVAVVQRSEEGLGHFLGRAAGLAAGVAVAGIQLGWVRV